MSPIKPIVFFDFDNTITRGDVLDDLIVRYSRDDGWKRLESRWQKGEIGTLECLDGQMRGIRISKSDLDTYLARIRLDPAFKKILALLRSRNIRTLILTDNFDYIVRRILRHHGITRVQVHANRIRWQGQRLVPSFPFRSKTCATCAHCKRESMRTCVGGHSMSVYVGDGLSDICAAQCAKLVFAKDNLLAYLRDRKMPHIPYKDLRDVHRYFKTNFHA